jgi:hypothetical protein
MKIYSVMEGNMYEGTRPGGFAVVLYHDYCALEGQYASYREAAGASIGANLNEQAIARISDLEKLLADAKRMAEFGDINADMEDDGIGWKQWYQDVSAILGSPPNGEAKL